MKKLIIIVVIAVLILGGGIAFWVLTSGSDSGNKNESQDTSQGTDRQQATTKTSINELFSQGGNVKCEYTYTDPTSGNTSSGTTYIGGKKMHGTFKMTDAKTGKTTESHMINDGQYVYTWTADSNQGTKMKIDTAAAEQASPDSPTSSDDSSTSSQAADNNQKYDFKCEEWTVDEAMFELPQGITFVDLSAQQQQIQNQACAQISDAAARQACLNAAQ